MRLVSTLAALHGMIGIAFAAIGAHTVHDPAAATRVASASTVEMIHALAALVTIALLPIRLGRVIAAAFGSGAALFAWAIYVHALGGPSLGPVAPVGGTMLIAAWAALAWVFARGLGRASARL